MPHLEVETMDHNEVRFLASHEHLPITYHPFVLSGYLPLIYIASSHLYILAMADGVKGFTHHSQPPLHLLDLALHALIRACLAMHD